MKVAQQAVLPVRLAALQLQPVQPPVLFVPREPSHRVQQVNAKSAKQANTQKIWSLVPARNALLAARRIRVEAWNVLLAPQVASIPIMELVSAQNVEKNTTVSHLEQLLVLLVLARRLHAESVQSIAALAKRITTGTKASHISAFPAHNRESTV